jgi:hypothetical protein
MQKAADTAPSSKDAQYCDSPMFEKWVCAYLTHALTLFADDEYCRPGHPEREPDSSTRSQGQENGLFGLYQQEFNEP